VQGIEISMKHVRAAGVHGVSSLTDMVCKEWIQDIFQNQVHKFIQGAGPIRPLYTVGSSAAKLVIFPAQHYWKEYHLLHEIQKGLKRVSSLYKIRKEVMSEERRNAKQNSSATILQS
jgi:autophagy-related protein 2